MLNCNIYYYGCNNFSLRFSKRTLPRDESLCQLFEGHRQQWISHRMNIWHQGQLKKLKSWGSFWSYQLNSTANLAHLQRNGGKWA